MEKLKITKCNINGIINPTSQIIISENLIFNYK